MGNNVPLGGRLGERRDEPPLPELLPPQPLVRILPVSAVAIFGVLAVGTLWMTQGGAQWFESTPHAVPEKSKNSPRLVVDAQAFPGAVTTTEKRLVLGAPYVFNTMALAPDEEKRLREDVERDRVLIGAVSLWDNVAEDGDAVVVEGAGYKVQLHILHKPAVFFVPYQPGGSIFITGQRDGGGGITLGVQTSLGDQGFPPLAPGQVMEVQLP